MKLISRVSMSVCALALVAGATSVASADTPVTIDGGWTILDQNMNQGDLFAGGPFTWASAGPTQLDVTDLYVITDQYNIFLNGNYVGSSTNVPDWPTYTTDPTDPSYFTADPEAAWGSPLWSHFSITLPAGVWSLEIQDIHIPPFAIGAGPYPDGTVAFRVSQVPAPGAAAILGLSGLAAFRRRRA